MNSRDALENWHILVEAFRASAKNISPDYFRISRFDAPSIHRERAYCYELYHQLRIQLGSEFPYVLHGEIDKRGHLAILQHCHGKFPNPDFLIHRPGKSSLGDNLAVIEVKSSEADAVGVRGDLEKIGMFLDNVGYEFGVFWCFGHRMVSLPQGRHDRLLVLHHSCAGGDLQVIHGEHLIK